MLCAYCGKAEVDGVDRCPVCGKAKGGFHARLVAWLKGKMDQAQAARAQSGLEPATAAPPRSEEPPTNQARQKTPPTAAPSGKPFSMKVREVVAVPGVGEAAAGTVENSEIMIGEEVDVLIYGTQHPRRCRVLAVLQQEESTELAVPGEEAALLLSGLQDGELKAGSLITAVKN